MVLIAIILIPLLKSSLRNSKVSKKKKESESSKAVIQRNTDIVQHVNTHVCGHFTHSSFIMKTPI